MSQTSDERRCGVCGGSALQPRFASTDFVSRERFDLMRCEACATLTTQPVPDDLDRYYPTRYRAFRGPIEAVFRWLYRRHVERVTRQVGGTGRVLDVGCGGGWMLRAFREAGWEAVGLERTEEVARQAAQFAGVPVRTGELAALDEAPFDLISFYNVLEHLPLPGQTLAACRALLRPGGRLHITLPNAGSWQARLTRGGWFHLDVPRHLFHFDPAALAGALERHGYTAEGLRNVSLAHDVYGWMQSVPNGLGVPTNWLYRWLGGEMPRAALLTPVGLAAGALAAGAGLAAAVLTPVSWPLRRGAIIECFARVRD